MARVWIVTKPCLQMFLAKDTVYPYIGYSTVWIINRTVKVGPSQTPNLSVQPGFAKDHFLPLYL